MSARRRVREQEGKGHTPGTAWERLQELEGRGVEGLGPWHRPGPQRRNILSLVAGMFGASAWPSGHSWWVPRSICRLRAATCKTRCFSG